MLRLLLLVLFLLPPPAAVSIPSHEFKFEDVTKLIKLKEQFEYQFNKKESGHRKGLNGNCKRILNKLNIDQFYMQYIKFKACNASQCDRTFHFKSTPIEIYAIRCNLLLLKESIRNQKTIDIISSCAQHINEKLIIKHEQYNLCVDCWITIHVMSRAKFYSYYSRIKNEGLTTISNRRSTVRYARGVSSNHCIVKAWMTQYFNFIACSQPNKIEKQLPSSLTKMFVWFTMNDQINYSKQMEYKIQQQQQQQQQLILEQQLKEQNEEQKQYEGEQNNEIEMVNNNRNQLENNPNSGEEGTNKHKNVRKNNKAKAIL